MIVKMTTAETDQTTWKDIGYNISTGQYQSSSGFIEADHEFTEISMCVHSFLFIRTIFIKTLRLRFAPKFKKMYELK